MFTKRCTRSITKLVRFDIANCVISSNKRIVMLNCYFKDNYNTHRTVDKC